PRYPLVRYSGVLGPHSKWRSAIVPRRLPSTREDHTEDVHGPADGVAARCRTPGCDVLEPSTSGARPRTTVRGSPVPAPSVAARSMQKPTPGSPPSTACTPAPLVSGRGEACDRGDAARITASGVPAAPATLAEGVEVGFNVITVRHWDRLLGGLLLAT